MNIRGILWDLDGTLVDSEPAHSAAFDAALRDFGLEVSLDFHTRLLGVNEEGVHAALVAETGASISRSDWSQRKWAHYRRYAAGIRRRASVAEVALGLCARRIPSAVVSNSTADEVAVALATTGLDTVLTTIVSVADVLRGKPDPEGYLLGAHRLGLPPSACLVIEDSLIGAAAGLSAGMRVIFHPQLPHANPAFVAPGAHYLAPDGDLGATIARALDTGELK